VGGHTVVSLLCSSSTLRIFAKKVDSYKYGEVSLANLLPRWNWVLGKLKRVSPQGNLCCIQQYGNDVSVPARVPSYADAARVTLDVSGVKTQHFGREGHSGHCECDLFMHKCALDLFKC